MTQDKIENLEMRLRNAENVIACLAGIVAMHTGDSPLLHALMDDYIATTEGLGHKPTVGFESYQTPETH